MTLDKIKPLAETKFLNLYEADYALDDGTTLPYVVASRHKLQTVADIDKKQTAAVHIFAVNSGGDKMLVTNEFRFAVNDTIADTPAGMIDEGESAEEAAKRELLEETGYDQVYITEVMQPSYSSAGLTNEMAQPVIAVVNEQSNVGQELDGPEQISAQWMTRKEVAEVLENGNLGARAQLAMKLFVNNALVLQKDLNKANEHFVDTAKGNYERKNIQFPGQEPIEVYKFTGDASKALGFVVNKKTTQITQMIDQNKTVIFGSEIENAKNGKPLLFVTDDKQIFIPAKEASKLVVHDRQNNVLSIDFSEAIEVDQSFAEAFEDLEATKLKL